MYLTFFKIEFLSDNFLLRHFVEFHDYIVLALVLKQPYFWVWKVGMLRWSFTDKQVLS